MGPLPQYQSHKIISALKLAAMEIHEDNSATLVPANTSYEPFETEPGWWTEKFKSGSYKEDDAGYYLVYPDGYKSWCPSETFEAGYSPVGAVNPHGHEG